MHPAKYLCLEGDSWKVGACTLQAPPVRLCHGMRKTKEGLPVLSAKSVSIFARDTGTSSHEQPDMTQPSFHCE
jgi:hypothetical protein